MVTSLFICHTPLHTLIAQRIIEKESLSNPIFIYLYESKNSTITHYQNKLKTNYHLIPIKKSNKFVNDLFQILINSYPLLGKKYNSYVGNIKSFHSRFILNLLSIQEINTFDDGSGNISGDGYFYDKNENWYSKLFFNLSDKKLLYSTIINRIKKHFTIFNYPNVFPNLVHLDLFNSNVIQNDNLNQNSAITIFISNAFSEDNILSLEEETLLIDKINDHFMIDYIIRHPREKYNSKYSRDYSFLERNKISEEIVKEFSQNNEVTVIGVYSTVLLNISSMKNVKLINIDYEFKNKPTKKLIPIFEELGIKNYRLS